MWESYSNFFKIINYLYGINENDYAVALHMLAIDSISISVYIEYIESIDGITENHMDIPDEIFEKVQRIIFYDYPCQCHINDMDDLYDPHVEASNKCHHYYDKPPREYLDKINSLKEKIKEHGIIFDRFKDPNSNWSMESNLIFATLVTEFNSLISFNRATKSEDLKGLGGYQHWRITPEYILEQIQFDPVKSDDSPKSKKAKHDLAPQTPQEWYEHNSVCFGPNLDLNKYSYQRCNCTW
jgi:hypothetical protein